MKRYLRRPAPGDEVDAELAFHVEMRTRELIAGGMDPDRARRAAVSRFGDYSLVSDTCKTIADQRNREMRRTEYLSELAQDVRFAFRQLLHNRAFTVVAVLTLALGIGASTAIFSAVRAVVLRPFAYADPDRVMIVGETWRSHPLANVSAGNFVDWAAQAKSFSHLAAVAYESFTLDEGETPERVSGAYVSATFFPVFGVRPAVGRTFTADEDQPGRADVVVLSHGLWEQRFAGNSAAIGQTMRINGRPHVIIGVMPAGFDPALAGEQLWTPIAFTPERRAIYDEHYLDVFGRLAPGVSPAQAQREMDVIALVQRSKMPLHNQGRGAAVARLQQFVVGDFRQRLFVMLGAVSLVMLIACGNVANLLLARGAARSKEIAIRSAIGAGRGRIVRQLLTESVVLGVTGAAGGLLLAWWLGRVLVAEAPPGIPRLDQTRIDGWVLFFALTAAIMSALIFGIVPALRAGRRDLLSTLREGGRTLAGATRDRVRGVLVVAEVALSLTLLVGAGLLIRSAFHLHRLDAGFDTRGLVAARVALPPRAYREGAAETALTFERIVEELRASPAVRSAAVTSQAPMGPGGNSNGLLPEGRALEPANLIEARLRIVSPGYFGTMGIRLLRGRDFSADDVREAPLVMVVSEELARRAWPKESPIGKRIMCCEGGPDDPRLKTIVGVVGDVRWRGMTQDATPEFYLPMRQIPAEAWSWTRRTMTVVARARASTATAFAAEGREGAEVAQRATADVSTAIRGAVKAVEPTVPVFSIMTFAEARRASTATTRFHTLLLVYLGAVGLLLAATGIYSVIAYFVSLRTHEIGVRIALGASSGDVLRLMTWQGIRPVLVGVAVGAVGAFWATRLLRGSLHGVSETDPATFAAVAGLLIVVSLIATLIPARRATLVDPTRALSS